MITKPQTKKNIMNKTSANTRKTLGILGLVLSLGAIPLLLGGTGCASNNGYQESRSQRDDDHDTSSRVRTALADDSEYKYGSVNVDTFKGTVQLSGFVNSRDQKHRAGDIAKNTLSVRDVVNNITVKESVN
jgi:hypothetical protein